MTVTVVLPVSLTPAVKTPVEESILPKVASLIDQVTGVVAPLAEKEVWLPLVTVELVGVTEMAVIVVSEDDVEAVELLPAVSSTAASHTGHPINKIPLKPSPNQINSRFFITPFYTIVCDKCKEVDIIKLKLVHN